MKGRRQCPQTYPRPQRHGYPHAEHAVPGNASRYARIRETVADYAKHRGQPVFAFWFRALSETNQSWSYKLLTLKPIRLLQSI